MATLGQPGKYAFCFAENESESPWTPLHVDRGFAAAASVVTVVGVSGTIEVVDSESNTAGELAQTFAQSMLIAGNVGSTGLLGGGEPLIVMPPEHAHVFALNGGTKAQAKAAIYERAMLAIDKLSPPLRTRAHASGAAANGFLRVARSPDDVMIVVAGGVGRKGAYIPTWSGTTKAVSREIFANPA
jgi:alanine dehydrogenase